MKRALSGGKRVVFPMTIGHRAGIDRRTSLHNAGHGFTP
jgi:hypothetical protein